MSTGTELEQIATLHAHFQEAEQNARTKLAARNSAIKGAVENGITKYAIAKRLGVTQTTIANAVAAAK